MKDMLNFKVLLARKNIGFYLECLASALSAVLIVVGCIKGGLSHSADFASTVVVYFAVGIIVAALSLWLDFDFMPLIPMTFFAIGFGVLLLNGAPTIADAINNIQFQGGDLNMIIIYLALSGVAMILSVVACFFGRRQLK